MTSFEKITELRNIIHDQLNGLITPKVALFGLPVHGNIGDSMIAYGELQLIKDNNSKCIYKRLFIDDSSRLPQLPTDCTILLQGGGDFGDVWRGIHEERLRIINNYPNHDIVILPQSVFYFDLELARQDALILSRHKKLTICARDINSFTFLSKHFANKILLVPDIAFLIPQNLLMKYAKPASKESLYLRRIDKELNSYHFETPPNAIIADWPTISNKHPQIRHIIQLIGYSDALRIRKFHTLENLLRKYTLDKLVKHLYLDFCQIGAEFISEYKNLVLTRLHSAILAILLNKEFTLLDNSYHKNRNFFNTWLSDVNLCHFFPNDK